MSISIGLEVELTVQRLARPVVCSFLPYTKEEPLDIEGNLYHKDASMFELAMRPASTGEELDNIYRQALQQAQSLLPAGAELVCVPSAEYTDEELASDEYASVLGCGASMNLYEGSVPMPDEYPDNRRYAGLHINIGTDGTYDQSIMPSHALCLDAVIGLHSVINWEQEHKEEIQARRSVYGRAGEYRMKEFTPEVHGIEYRTLPASSWVQTTGSELFQMVRRALSLPPELVAPYAHEIQSAIDTCDLEAAISLSHTIARRIG